MPQAGAVLDSEGNVEVRGAELIELNHYVAPRPTKPLAARHSEGNVEVRGELA